MSNFKPKRIGGAGLTAQLSSATANLPAAMSVLSALQEAPSKQRPPPVVQINFKASRAFADLIACEAEKAGSARRLFARLMRDAGYNVPEADVSPPGNRRRSPSMRRKLPKGS
jgi:hypothetical protein